MIGKSNKEIGRLKTFDKNKSNLSDKHIEKRFKENEISTIIKRVGKTEGSSY